MLLSEALRFWIVDLWGDGWDRHRRRLLFRHFWAYLRHPHIPAEYLPAGLVTEESQRQRATAQTAFSVAYLKRIQAVQAGPGSTRRVYLTYRPLGKNLRLLGTAIRENVDLGRRVLVAERASVGAKGVEGDRARLGPLGLGLLKSSKTFWASHDSARAWNELFHNSRANGGKVGAIAAPRVAHLTFSEPPFSPASMERVLKLAAATRYVFTPTEFILDRIRELKAKLDWPERPVLGIHVRRGDAASTEVEGSAPTKSTRTSFPLEFYLRTADIICERYGIRDIFLGTESRAEIDRANRLRPGYRFLALDYDRSIFPDISTSN